jgi:hypothetical protein
MAWFSTDAFAVLNDDDTLGTDLLIGGFSVVNLLVWRDSARDDDDTVAAFALVHGIGYSDADPHFLKCTDSHFAGQEALP